MTDITDMFAANVHFGHQTSRWNPKMIKYIFAPRNGIYIIDLRKTALLMKKAIKFTIDLITQEKKILFIGTKKQAKDIIYNECIESNQFFVNNRWLGGMLTNFNTIKKSVERMKHLETQSTDGTFDKLPKKEVAFLNRELNKLTKNLFGIRNMVKLPDAIFVIDPNYEKIAIKEAINLNIPIIAITDTNCNPELITYPIPGNDDSMKSIAYFVKKFIKLCAYTNAEHI